MESRDATLLRCAVVAFSGDSVLLVRRDLARFHDPGAWLADMRSFLAPAT